MSWTLSKIQESKWERQTILYSLMIEVFIGLHTHKPHICTNKHTSHFELRMQRSPQHHVTWRLKLCIGYGCCGFFSSSTSCSLAMIFLRTISSINFHVRSDHVTNNYILVNDTKYQDCGGLIVATL